MSALAMRWQLRQLMHRHGVTVAPSQVALAPASDAPMVLEGIASTADIDTDRMQFEPFAFGPIRNADLPLLYRHDPNQIAGRIHDLRYGQDGTVLIRATVEHPLARRCGAFSISARVLDYAIRDADTDKFHAVISSAELTEISCTDRPANARCIVTHRHRVSPAVEFYDLLGQQVDCLRRIVQHAQKEQPQWP